LKKTKNFQRCSEVIQAICIAALYDNYCRVRNENFLSLYHLEQGFSTFCYLSTPKSMLNPFMYPHTKIDFLGIPPKPLLFTFSGLILISFKVMCTPWELLAYQGNRWLRTLFRKKLAIDAVNNLAYCRHWMSYKLLYISSPKWHGTWSDLCRLKAVTNTVSTAKNLSRVPNPFDWGQSGVVFLAPQSRLPITVSQCVFRFAKVRSLTNLDKKNENKHWNKWRNL
jgi:hypothetical protein